MKIKIETAMNSIFAELTVLEKGTTDEDHVEILDNMQATVMEVHTGLQEEGFYTSTQPACVERGLKKGHTRARFVCNLLEQTADALSNAGEGFAELSLLDVWDGLDDLCSDLAREAGNG